MDLPLRPLRSTSVFPWRTFAVVAGLVAGVELLLLVVLGGALIAKPDSVSATKHKAKTAASASAGDKAAPKAPERSVPAADLARRKVKVMILNGNGRSGAAAATASAVGRRGYRVGTVGNAPSHDYSRSLVMYRRGFEGEGVRLARDLRIALVGPLDGIRPKALAGAHAVVILGG